VDLDLRKEGGGFFEPVAISKAGGERRSGGIRWEVGGEETSTDAVRRQGNLYLIEKTRAGGHF